ncbi:Hypothetical protein MELLADRAFT_113750 [Melampsora larici-populina 98AG31]|uniref:Secreted protein n=1 Tax=Melampsora larici-populina (strain 98AG31 / pathotype 3-4-7) TaxID=747676 RepID=F4SAY6_MELLP|nr:Hypothetical protein MELLADRAFT_113750 [Melampsora larici-populina 98AG31]EGF98202.1 Hypothetical protein MELLADRAFT_113750 [Melampsora larici-populina 98AG31]
MFIRYGIILLPLLAFLDASGLSKMNGVMEESLQRNSTVEEAQFSPRTAGPSGRLIKPGGGSVYQNHVSNVGAVEVIYIGVSDGSNEYGARTCTIDLHLVPRSGKGDPPKVFNISDPSVTSLASGMRPHDSGSDQPIRASFVPPVGACGDYCEYTELNSNEEFEVLHLTDWRHLYSRHGSLREAIVPGECCPFVSFKYPKDIVIHFQSAAPLITFKCAGSIRTTIVVNGTA